MSHSTPDPSTAGGTVHDGLLEHHDAVGDASQWAFGTDFEDPLAGIDTTVPERVDASNLATYCLMLGDDALIMSQRLSEWCSNAPDLEEDIALSNIALDLLGQARFLLARAAAADPSVVPVLPDHTPVPVEDALAFFRDPGDFLNVRLAEVRNGDFAHTIARLLLFSTWRLAVFEALVDSRDPVLAAVAAKGVKEMSYHRDFAGRWFLTLARGTKESRDRLITALTELWPLFPELLMTHEIETSMAEAGVGVAPESTADEVQVVIAQVLAVSGIERPIGEARTGVQGRTGRHGSHSEALSRLLGEMQVVARAHPMGQW